MAARGLTKNGQYKTRSKDSRKNGVKRALKLKFGASFQGAPSSVMRTEETLADIRANLEALGMTEEEVCRRK